MCGPLRILVQGGPSSRMQYQGGRLLSYLLLGFAAGSLGASLPLPLLLALVGGGILLSLVDPRIPIWNRVRSRALQAASTHPFLLGSASGMLPCGLLHLWLVAAGASASGFQGAMLLAMLWLGSLPALELGSSFLQKLIAPLRQRFPRALPLVLVLLALLPIFYRATLQAEPGSGSPTCHEQ